jgi:hypothetical protein
MVVELLTPVNKPLSSLNLHSCTHSRQVSNIKIILTIRKFSSLPMPYTDPQLSLLKKNEGFDAFGQLHSATFSYNYPSRTGSQDDVNAI